MNDENVIGSRNAEGEQKRAAQHPHQSAMARVLQMGGRARLERGNRGLPL